MISVQHKAAERQRQQAVLMRDNVMELLTVTPYMQYCVGESSAAQDGLESSTSEQEIRGMFRRGLEAAGESMPTEDALRAEARARDEQDWRPRYEEAWGKAEEIEAVWSFSLRGT